MTEEHHDDERGGLSRRDLLQRASVGFGWLAFAGLASERSLRAGTGALPTTGGPLDPKEPHFRPRARRVLFLRMQGAPSHVDTFDYKPALTRDDGKTVRNQRRRNAKLLGSPWQFRQHGESGLWVSELFPEVAKHADELCMLHGMHTDSPAHPQAFVQLHTGSSQFVRPSLGAWTLYGLGTENENLPGFISLCPPTGLGGSRNYGSAFLPALYQGTRIGRQRQMARARVPNIANPRMPEAAQREQLDLVQALNRARAERDPGDGRIDAVIQSYELAFRMQTEVPGIMALDDEPEAVRQAYGIGTRETDDFGRQCLLARRLLESGVRFVELSWGNWDQHRNLRADHARHAKSVDQPIAALLDELRQRGMLEDTLVIWGGEFGRTPSAQGTDGRDHNNKGFTYWLAGAGVKGGYAHGATDEHGFAAVEGRMHIHDLHATVLHLLGLDHKRLTFNYAGRDFRLTDVHGRVARDIMA